MAMSSASLTTFLRSGQNLRGVDGNGRESKKLMGLTYVALLILLLILGVGS